MTRSVGLFVLTSVAGSLLGQVGPERAGKAPLSADEQAAALNAVREYARTYTASLPNYTCIQSTRQLLTRPAALAGGPIGRPSRIDLIEEQLSVVNGRELRTLTRINERRPSDAERTAIGTLSHGEFANLLDTIFDPRNGADIRWERAASLDGHRVYLFAYQVPQQTGYTLVGPRGNTRVPFEGVVYADSRTGAVLRIEMKCTGIPRESGYRTVALTLDYKPARVADREFLLPARFSMRYEMNSGGAIIGAEYKSYKRFSADSTIRFGDDAPSQRTPDSPEGR